MARKPVSFPVFDRFIKHFEYDTIEVVCKALLLRWKQQNLSAAERSATASVLNLDVDYNSSDKKYGPVMYSKELSRVQCQLHLEDASKRTYRKIVDETKEDILQSFLLKLRSLLCRFKERGAPWDYHCNFIIREASMAMLSKEENFSSFHSENCTRLRVHLVYVPDPTRQQLIT